jgi:hypothetical protein
VRAALDRFAKEPAPHQPPAIVRAALRDRLLNLLRDDLLTADTASEALPRLPWSGRSTPAEVVWRRAGRPLTEVQRRQFVEGHLADFEALLFDRAGGCRFCHVAKAVATPRLAGGGLPEYEPTRRTVRWQPHARFRHSAHRTVGCQECHAVAPGREGAALIPAIETCAACHNPQAGARHDCAACHIYHREDR